LPSISRATAEEKAAIQIFASMATNPNDRRVQ
jgi:hypothetical protein